MKEIKIDVYKQMDGYTFSLSVSIRQLIKKLFPNSHPANTIFVSYDTKSDFELFIGTLEKYIYPALLGVDVENLRKQISKITFVDTQTDSILNTCTP